MLILVGPLIAFAGIVALFLVLRARARMAHRSMYFTAREDRARKVREARELAMRSTAAETEPAPPEVLEAGAARPPEVPSTRPEPAPAGLEAPPTTSEPAPAGLETPPATWEPAPAGYEAPPSTSEPAPAWSEVEPELQPAAEVETEPLPPAQSEPEVEAQPAWLAVPQRASAAGAAASTAAVDEPQWLPSQTHPPRPRRPVEIDADQAGEPPTPWMASTVVSYVVLAASLVVILLGIAVMIGMSRG